MFVYGLPGRKSPYAICVVTQMQLSYLFLNSKIFILGRKDFSSVILKVSTKSLIFFSFSDTAKNWQFGFQDPATSIMEGIIDLHHDVMYFLV
jgi:hypothetical protein